MMPVPIAIERASDRLHRSQNTPLYRCVHWLLWIPVLYVATSPWMYELFALGPDWRMAWHLAAVASISGVAALAGKLPGCEPVPYVLYFVEHKPNPRYRRVCYAAAWSALLTPTIVHAIGLAVSVVLGRSYQDRWYGLVYVPVAVIVWSLGLAGRLPRTRPATSEDAVARRQFYSCIWASSTAHAVLLITVVTVLPRSRKSEAADIMRLVTFMIGMCGTYYIALRGILPRTRLIVGTVPSQASGAASASRDR